MNELTEDYQRKINTINELLKDSSNSEETINRLRIKVGCYRAFLTDLNRALNMPLVANRFLAIAHYPNMEHKVNDVIELPNDNWKHADGTFCDADYFRDYPDYFKEI